MARTPKTIVKTEEVKVKPKRVKKEVNPYNVEPTTPVVKRGGRTKKIQALVDADTTVREVVVNLPDDTVVESNKNALPRGIIVANVIIALIVGLGILVWNYNTNWDKPVNKVEISNPVANPFSVAKTEPTRAVTEAPLKFMTDSVTVTPPITVPDKPAPVTPTLPPSPVIIAPIEVNNNSPFLQNNKLTPGAVDETATKDSICNRGYARHARKHIPQSNKLKVFELYNIDWKTDNFEVDHLIPLGLGGANSVINLWPQSYTTRPWNAHMKDKLETTLHSMVCSGDIELKEAQELIQSDWIFAYKKIVKE